MTAQWRKKNPLTNFAQTSWRVVSTGTRQGVEWIHLTGFYLFLNQFNCVFYYSNKADSITLSNSHYLLIYTCKRWQNTGLFASICTKIVGQTGQFSPEWKADKHSAAAKSKFTAGYLTNFLVLPSREKLRDWRGCGQEEGWSCMQRQSERFKIHISRRQSTDRCLCKWLADGFISSLALNDGELHRSPQLGRIIIEDCLLCDVGNIWNILHNGIIGQKAAIGTVVAFPARGCARFHSH